MTGSIGWGILGTGAIAHSFAEDLLTIPDTRLVAVGSRHAATAREFATRLNIPGAHGSYEELVSDPQVDVVYIATPHHRHYADAMLALGAGKHVLCEKPFAINARQADAVAGCARTRELFCMEAMWTRFLPLMQAVRRRVLDAEIGQLRSIDAEFGYANRPTDRPRLFQASMGGGALLDLGVYGVSLAQWFFGPPTTVQAVASIGTSGVDEQDRVLLQWDDGRLASIGASIVTRSRNTALLSGSSGSVTLEDPFCRPPAATFSRFSSANRPQKVAGILHTVAPLMRQLVAIRGRLRASLVGHGYRYEALETMHCIRRGRIESDTMPLADSIGVMETLDRIRSTIGLVFPSETEGLELKRR